MQIVETGLPVERMFCPRHYGAPNVCIVGTGRGGRLSKELRPFANAARRLTATGRNFALAFAEIGGGKLAELQMVPRMADQARRVRISSFSRFPARPTFLLVGPGPDGGLLTADSSCGVLRPGDLWYTEDGVLSVQLETTQKAAAVLLMQIDSSV